MKKNNEITVSAQNNEITVKSINQLFEQSKTLIERVMSLSNEYAYIWGTEKKPTKFEQYNDFCFTSSDDENEYFEKCLLVAYKGKKVFDMWVHAYRRKDAKSKQYNIQFVDFCLSSELYDTIKENEHIKDIKHTHKASYLDCTEILKKCDLSSAINVCTVVAKSMLDTISTESAQTEKQA